VFYVMQVSDDRWERCERLAGKPVNERVSFAAMNTVRLWWAAARPFSFTASIIPVLVGTILAAYDEYTWWIALLALVGAVAIHAGTNLVNDYYDHRKGADSDSSLGPPGTIQRGVLQPRTVLVGGIVAFVAGIVIGLVLAATTNWQLLGLGVAAVLAGFLYTGAPLHLAYRGLGEVTVFIFMGPVIVMGAYFVQVESWDWQPLVASLPIAFLVTAILQANNLRDIDHDRRVAKRTVATMIGRTWANREMYGLLAAAYVALVVAAAVDAMHWSGLLALVTAPFAVSIARNVRDAVNARQMNYILFKTAQLHMRFGVLMALGLGIGLILEEI
jgi:1,4-dihydroxy-2-naphthoate polyprenyltransferase